jgi:hypothetical protein
MAKGILQHETRHTRAGIQHRKNEQRFKHDGKVIPERHHGGATQTVRKDLRHSERESRSAAGAEK